LVGKCLFRLRASASDDEVRETLTSFLRTTPHEIFLLL
jgi:hypothetical protein